MEEVLYKEGIFEFIEENKTYDVNGEKINIKRKFVRTTWCKSNYNK